MIDCSSGAQCGFTDDWCLFWDLIRTSTCCAKSFGMFWPPTKAHARYTANVFSRGVLSRSKNMAWLDRRLVFILIRASFSNSRPEKLTLTLIDSGVILAECCTENRVVV